MNDKYATKEDFNEGMGLLKKDLTNTITQAVEAILDSVSEMMNRSENRLDAKITKNHAAIKDNGRKIRDTQLDTPTQKEFNELKTKVNLHHPTN